MFNAHKSKFEELERLRQISNMRNFAEGLLIGASVGAIVGLLFAPKKGKDSREMICDGAKKMGDQVISVIPMFGCCCDDECYDDEFCCGDEDCCIGDECGDDYEVEYDKENPKKKLDPIEELESEK